MTSSPRSDVPGGWSVVITTVLVGLVVAVPVASFSGAAAPLLIGDAGPLVRWGMTLVGVVHDLAAPFGTLDRVVVNAGLGKGVALGKGRPDANRETAMTNFVGALSQTEAALEVFRAQEHGHLVMVSSMSALRGMRKAMTVYAATKAGVASLAEGLRSERVPGLDVSVIYPGYIRSEMNEKVEQRTKFMVDTEIGVRGIVEAIEKGVDSARVPAWPWKPLGTAMRHLPLAVVRKLT